MIEFDKFVRRTWEESRRAACFIDELSKETLNENQDGEPQSENDQMSLECIDGWGNWLAWPLHIRLTEINQVTQPILPGTSLDFTCQT